MSTEAIELAEKAYKTAETKLKKIEEEYEQAENQYRITCDTAKEIVERVADKLGVASGAVITTRQNAIAAYREDRT